VDVPNNFPRHSIRTAGPYLVLLGLAEDDEMLKDRFTPVAEQSARQPRLLPVRALV
jgi:hypothetical protein